MKDDIRRKKDQERMKSTTSFLNYGNQSEIQDYKDKVERLES